ncbi:hypothetical protein [Streptodolium elevatio]|uniref:Metallothionein n=1 Tax=Streptodolium elevatio TaxID=3157996 RepID=A0ABV3DKW0_9ACTN
MTHDHDDCPTPTYGARCTSGVVYGYCGADVCTEPDCVDIGHCECACHHGQTCGCGHVWPASDDTTEMT